MESSIWFSLLLSLRVALATTILAVIIGCFIAYLLAQRTFFGRDFLDVLFTLPIILPPTVTGYYLLIIFGKNGFLGRYIYSLTGYTIVFSWHAAVLASFIVSLPLMIKTATYAFETVDKNYIEIAKVHGYSRRETFFLITLPLAKPGLIAGAALTFARAAGEFGATLMVAGNIPGETQTMPLMIYSEVAAGNRVKADILVAIFTFFGFAVLYAARKITQRGTNAQSRIF